MRLSQYYFLLAIGINIQRSCSDISLSSIKRFTPLIKNLKRLKNTEKTIIQNQVNVQSSSCANTWNLT